MPNEENDKFEEILALLKEKYAQAKAKKYINNPLAYALYEIWKIADTRRW